VDYLAANNIEAENVKLYGKIIFARNVQEFEKERKKFHSTYKELVIVVVCAMLIITISYLVLGVPADTLFWIIILIFLLVILPIIAIFFFFILPHNRFIIYEKGISPATLPLEYVRKRKRFVSYSEIEQISLEKDEHTKNHHFWRFRFQLKDGKSFTVIDEREQAYIILKQIMEKIRKRDSFSADEFTDQSTS
jgi:hypothetical protein